MLKRKAFGVKHSAHVIPLTQYIGYYIQRYFYRVGAYRHNSHTKVLQEAGLQPLTIRRNIFGLCQYFKIINYLVPEYLTIMVPRRVD